MRDGLLGDREDLAAAPASTWRLTPHAQENFARAYGSTFWMRAMAWFFWLVGVAYYLLGVRPMIAASSQGGDAGVLAATKALVMVGASQWALLLLYRRLRDQVDIGPGIRRLQTKVPDEEACRARVAVRLDGVVLGEDEGYLWFEGGTLFYKGLQTVFRLNRPDVELLDRWPRRDREANDPTIASDRSLLRLSEKGRSVLAVFVEPFDEHEARARIAAFRRRLAAWLRADEPATLESLLPPRGLHPSLAAVQAHANEPVFAGGLMVATYMVMALSTPHDFRPAAGAGMTPALVDAAVLALAVAAAVATRSHWRASSVRTAALREGSYFSIAD